MQQDSKTPQKATVGIINRRKKMPKQTAWLAAAAALVVVLLVVFIARQTSTQGAPTHTRLLYANSKTGKLSVTDTSGKQLYQLNYPSSSYPAFSAVGPDGRVLVSLSAGGGNGGFILAKDGEAGNLSSKVIDALRSAVVLNNATNLFFTGNNTAVYVNCDPDCRLMSLNFTNGQTKVLTGTGVKNSFPAPAYLLGLSNDHKSAYLRVVGANRLGDSKNAIYKIDINSGNKKTQISLPADAGNNVSLSPDKTSYVYSTGGYSTPVKLHVTDINAQKTVTTTWAKDTLSDMPGTLVWSPNGQYVLFASAFINMPPDAKSTAKKDTVLAYLDTAKHAITSLQTVQDQAKNQLPYWGWLDNGTVVYEQDTTSSAYDYVSLTRTVYQDGKGSKKAAKLSSGQQLLQIYRY